MPKKKSIYYCSDNVLEEFYDNLHKRNKGYFSRVHIPRSDVFYLRRDYFEKTGNWVSLDRMERSMYLEGLLNKSDVFDPDTKRDWE